MVAYQECSITLSEAQFKKILTAEKNKSSVTIRILKKNLHGDHKLLLTQTQINRLNKATSGVDLTLSIAQVKPIYKLFHDIQKENDGKTGGFLPLLALLPLIFGGIGAAGGIAGGVANAVSAARNARSADANLAETQRHNREVELQLKSGTGVLSNLASKIPVFGATLKYALEKRGLGLNDCNKVASGECVCLGKGLYLKHIGGGLFLGPEGSGLFLGQSY